jgi:hypothetical protein
MHRFALVLALTALFAGVAWGVSGHAAPADVAAQRAN